MLKTLLTSKKFVAAIVISPILAYIVGQGVADHGKSRAQEIVKALSVEDANDIAADVANEELKP